MNKLYMVAVIFGLFAITSCAKKDTASRSGGSWTVNSITYTATSSAIIYTASVEAKAADGTILRVIFYNSAPSANGSANGTYSVVDYWGANPSYNQVALFVYNKSGVLFGSTSGGGTTVTSSNGTVTISGSGIPMAVATSAGVAGTSVGNMTFSMYY